MALQISRSQDGVVGTTIDALDPSGGTSKVLLPNVAVVAGLDSTGTALPSDFDSLAQTLTPGTYGPTAVAVTNGTNTWTQTLTYDGSGNLTNVSTWVKS